MHEKTTPYTPEQNGVAERMSRTLVEKAKCLLFDRDMEKKYWAEAINMAAYLVNRTPCDRLKSAEMKTPEEIFFGKKCDLSDLKLFGSKVMVLKPKQKRKKWDGNRTKMLFIGYEHGVKGYRCFDEQTKKIVTSRNVRFYEETDTNTVKLDLCSESNVESNKNEELVQEKRENENESEKENMSENETANEIEIANDMDESEMTITANDSNVSVNESDSASVSDETAVNDSVYESSNDTTTDDDPSFNTRAQIDGSQRSSSRTKKPFVPYQAHFAFLMEPATRKEAVKSERREDWQKAMEDEIKSHRQTIRGLWSVCQKIEKRLQKSGFSR